MAADSPVVAMSTMAMAASRLRDMMLELLKNFLSLENMKMRRMNAIKLSLWIRVFGGWVHGFSKAFALEVYVAAYNNKREPLRLACKEQVDYPSQ